LTAPTLGGPENDGIVAEHGRWYEHDGTAEPDRAIRWLDCV